LHFSLTNSSPKKTISIFLPNNTTVPNVTTNVNPIIPNKHPTPALVLQSFEKSTGSGLLAQAEMRRVSRVRERMVGTVIRVYLKVESLLL
jgi:hypothetical protein